MASPVSILWFRSDLRLDDNPALHAALAGGGGVIPVFIWDQEAEGAWPMGAASRCWLHESLGSLDTALREAGSRLIILTGDALDILRKLITECGAAAVYWNRRYEPAAMARDKAIEAALGASGVTVQTFNSHLLFEPWEVQTQAGTPYKVFTPFYRACLAHPAPGNPLKAPKTIARPTRWPDSSTLEQLKLRPRIPWDAGIRSAWKPGEGGGAAQLARFVRQALAAYHEKRDRPDCEGTSRLSPHLHFGEISPRRVWHAVRLAMHKQDHKEIRRGAEGYLRQLCWREFAYHLLFHFPETPTVPLKNTFDHFPWRKDSKSLRAWQQGRTGYPIVDAGMRQLWTTGWMHNRVRMLAGSFLVKDLLIPWQCGAKWFWDTLVDADLANNTLGWQWVAGCGADASPFFRIFNPVTQGERFDPKGDYVRRWIPELANLPAKWIHKPWLAPAPVLREAGVILGKSYPRPIVDHEMARKRALNSLRR